MAAESVSESSLILHYGGKFFFKISTDNVKVVDTLCTTALKLGALYAGYKLLRPIVDAAVKKALGGERDDQGNPDIESGSLHVKLHCFTDERFLEVLADYESGRMKERLQEEFSQVGIKAKGLKVEIENMVEVNEKKKAIIKRYDQNSITMLWQSGKFFGNVHPGTFIW